MKTSFKVSTVLLANRELLYKAWLSSKEHSAFTGGKARIQAKVGGRFTAWDGYITGTTVVLEPYRRIVQSWRTLSFLRASLTRVWRCYLTTPRRVRESR